MVRFVLTYDLAETEPDPHYQFLLDAEQNGWLTWIQTQDSLWYKLPNTTLVGEFADYTAAKASFDSAVAATSKTLKSKVIVEKWFIASYSGAHFNSDDITKTSQT